MANIFISYNRKIEASAKTGHAQLSTTADIYTHILPEVKKDALNLMDRILTAK